MNTENTRTASAKQPADAPHQPTAADAQSSASTVQRQLDEASRGLAALTQAVEFMGFDAQKLITAICEPNDGYWKALSLRSVRMSVDKARLHELEPTISLLAEATAQAWLDSVRRRKADRC